MPSYPLNYNQFKDALAKGELPGLHCLDCDIVITPPNGVCTACGSANLEKTELKPEGAVRTFTVIRVGPPGRPAPYVVAMVELDDGPWVVGNLIDADPDQVGLDVIGKRVTVGHQMYPLPEGEPGLEGAALTFTLAG